MKKWSSTFLRIVFLLGTPMIIWAAPNLTVGTASGLPGTTALLPITFDTSTAAVTSLQFDLTLPPSLSTGAVTEQSILTSAAKSVATSFIGGVWRIIIYGVNQAPMAGGNVLAIQFPIAAGAPIGPLNIPISGVIFSDLNGIALSSGTNTAGTLTVNLPPLDLTGIDGNSYHISDELSFTYPATGVNFTWSFQSTGASASTVLGAPATANTPLTTTQSPKLNLSQFLLSPGKYMLTVTATAGGQSQTASANITLVNADLSSVKISPNPWRSDKHTGKPITFSQLTTNTTIKIFSTSGHEVRKLSGGPSITWDLTNDSGDKVGSGIYIYVMTDPQGNKVKGKLAIIK